MTEAAANAAAVANATKASGAIVNLEPTEFQRILSKADHPLVVMAHSKFFGEKWEYIFGHRGLVFYTRSKTQLMFSSRAELIAAKSIWIPG